MKKNIIMSLLLISGWFLAQENQIQRPLQFQQRRNLPGQAGALPRGNGLARINQWDERQLLRAIVFVTPAVAFATAVSLVLEQEDDVFGEDGIGRYMYQIAPVAVGLIAGFGHWRIFSLLDDAIERRIRNDQEQLIVAERSTDLVG